MLIFLVQSTNFTGNYDCLFLSRLSVLNNNSKGIKKFNVTSILESLMP